MTIITILLSILFTIFAAGFINAASKADTSQEAISLAAEGIIVVLCILFMWLFCLLTKIGEKIQ